MNATLKSDQIIYFGQSNTPVVGCIYHEGYFIQNFCKREECGLPMCPECVKIHAEEHAENKWTNEFELFSNCLTEKYNQQLEYLNRWAVDVQETFNLQEEVTKNSEIQKQRLQEAKAQFYQAVDEYFKQIENQIVNETAQQTQELLREIRAQHRMDYLDWDIQHKLLKKLNSEKCLPPLIKMYRDKDSTPEAIYLRHHIEHTTFMQRIRHSLRHIIINDRLPQILPLLRQFVYLSPIITENHIQLIHETQNTVQAPQYIQQTPQIAQSQIIQDVPAINKYQSKVIQPFSIMREQIPMQPMIYQPAPMVPIQPISFYPQQQYQEQFYPQMFESAPLQPQYLAQSTPPQIIRSPSSVRYPQPQSGPNSSRAEQNNGNKMSMAQRYYDQMNKNETRL